MEAKFNNNLNNQNALGKVGQTISEYPATKPNHKENEKNQKFAEVKNLNILNVNREENPNAPFSQNVTTKSLSNKDQSTESQNQNKNENQKNETNLQFGNMNPTTEQNSSSTNDFNYNFDSYHFSSLGENNQNQKIESNNFSNFGKDISNYQVTFNIRNEDNYYLSNADIEKNTMSMNDNINLKTNDNFKTNNTTNEKEKKDETGQFEYNDMLFNELIDTNNLDNQFSPKEGEFNFSEYTTTKNDEKSNQHQFH